MALAKHARGLVPKGFWKALFPGMSGTRSLGLVVAGGAGLWVSWLAPISPVAVWRADLALATGDAEAAVSQYDAIASYSPVPAVRGLALWRGAMVWSVELKDAAAARERLERYVEVETRPEDLAAAWERIGALDLQDRERKGEAAQAFRMAYQSAPAAPAAADRLFRSAQASAEAGRVDEAIELYAQVEGRFPEHATAGRLARAELLLARGDAQAALPIYEAAIKGASNEGEAEAARLGAAACLERLGNLDQAIAEIEETDLSEAAREARTEGMRARLDSAQQPKK